MITDTNLSVVVPCYNEAECLNEFHKRMTTACNAARVSSYEIIFVNDGSTDDSLKILFHLQRDEHVKIIDLARNHGHQIALSAGLSHSRGDRILVIDADLQDPPELLSAMMKTMDEGADVVYGQRNRRKGDGLFKRTTAALFYRLLSKASQTSIIVDTGDFRLMRRHVVDILVSMPEAHRFTRGLVSWVGFNQVPVGYDRDPRFAGTTKYSFLKMLAFSFDAITAFAISPLRFIFLVAMLAMGVAVLAAGWTIYSFFFLDAAPGWSSLMCVFLLFTSVQLFSTAFIGEYVGRIFIETKRRPLFVIRAIYPPAADTTLAEAERRHEHHLR
jgi:polyisoprenyl-phosphate glycosyltransferase